MPTDPAPLVQRVVHAAATAIQPAYGWATERKAARAVSAALRELDAVLEEERRDYLSQERLRALADSIEKGGE